MSINLLPEEMREKEQQELAKLKKKKEEEIEMTRPTLGKEPAKSVKRGFFGFLKSFRGEKTKPVEVKKIKRIGEERVEKPIESAKPEPSTKTGAQIETPKSEESPKSFEKVERIIASRKGEKIPPRKEMGEGLEISLMPSAEEIAPSLIRRRKKFFLIGLVSALVIFSLVWVGFKIRYGDILNQIKKIEREIKIVEEQTKEYFSLRDKIIILNKKAGQAEKILAQHIYWTKFFNNLDANTVPGVFYSEFSADAGGKIFLSAVGKDMISIIQQLASFQQVPNFIKSITINNISRGEKGINFTLGLNLVEDFFNK